MKFLLLLVALIVSSQADLLRGEDLAVAGNGVANAKEYNLRVGVNGGKQFGGGVLLSPFGIAVTCKHVVAGFTDGRCELPTGKQLKFVVLDEAKSRDIVFLLLETKVSCQAVRLRESGTLREGEGLVCRASVAQGPLCTIRGSLAFSPNTGSSGVFVGQLPLSPGSSGAGVFDTMGKLVGIILGPVTEKENRFIRGWSSDVLAEEVVSCLADGRKSLFRGVKFTDLTVTDIGIAVSRFKVGDRILGINGVRLESDLELILACSAIASRPDVQAVVIVLRGKETIELKIDRG